MNFFIDTKTGLSTFNIHFNVYINRSIVHIRSIGSIILTVCGERWLNMSVDYVFVTSQLTIKVYISQVVITIRRRKIDRKVHSLHMWNNNNNIIQCVSAQKYIFLVSWLQTNSMSLIRFVIRLDIQHRNIILWRHNQSNDTYDEIWPHVYETEYQVFCAEMSEYDSLDFLWLVIFLFYLIQFKSAS